MTTEEFVYRYLRCPTCGCDLAIKANSLECSKKHEFKFIGNVFYFIGTTKLDYSDHWEQYNKLPPPAQKIEQAKTFVDWALDGHKENITILDLGCGDGNHINYLPLKSIKIALDYSSAVNIVRERYKNEPNLFIIQADANNIPLKDEVIDQAISYSCLNHLENITFGFIELQRVTKIGGHISVWGYGTSNFLAYLLVQLFRGLYKLLPFEFLRKTLTFSLVPGLLFFKNTTGINPIKNSLKECMEIISTNLVPQYLHVMYRKKWNDFAPNNLKHLGDYKINCGQKFLKKQYKNL